MAGALRQATITKNYPTITVDVVLQTDVLALANQLPGKVCWIYVGGTGDVDIVTEQNTRAVFKAVPAGTYLWVSAQTIKFPTTTATNLLVGWSIHE